jgi:hypothetical protein
MRALLLPAVIGLVLLPSQLPASNTDSEGPVLQAESCRVELTGLGQDHWRESFRYTGTADDEGRISPRNLVRMRSNDAMASFVRLDQFESCMTGWVFSRPGQYSILFTAGTGGDALRHWSVTVSSVPTVSTITTLAQLRSLPRRQFRLVFPRG